MSDSAISPPIWGLSEPMSPRIDQAHDGAPAKEAGPDPTPWLALAGRDASQTTEQLDRQTNELLEYVERQNHEIDSRQAELNARLAQLDSELRAARLRSTQKTGDDLLAVEKADSADPAIAEPERAPATVPEETESTPADPQSRVSAESPEDQPTSATSGPGPDTTVSPGEFDDVEKVVAEIADVCGPPSPTSPSPPTPSPTPPSASPAIAEPPTVPPTVPDEHIPTEAGAPGPEDPMNFEDPVKFEDPVNFESNDSFSFVRSPGLDQELGHIAPQVDLGTRASSREAAAVESERRLLAERKIELDRRKLVLQRMHDETQALHREALEMRLVTEQLWAELSEKTPTDHLQQLLGTLRSRLDDHYASRNQTLSDRKSELVKLRNRLHEKQLELRGQSRKLQEWVESRHDEIKSHAAQLDARETLLNRREHRLQDEFAKWEAQQRQYKQQLNGLLRKISLAGLSDPKAPG